MFKLIASDMDGTLLDENGQVPPETYELILALHEHGVHFAASSGRRYDRLCEFFAPVRDKMDFVAANGAQVYADGKMVDREVYSHLAIRRLAQAVRTFPICILRSLTEPSPSCSMTSASSCVRSIRTFPMPSAFGSCPIPT